MPNDLLKLATYINRFKARIGNPTDDGTRPVAPEGAGDSWFNSTTRELSLPDSAGTSWVDYKVAFSKEDATTFPVSSNDNTEGYHVGSLWVDVTANTAYVCVDASTGVAIWDEVGAGGGVGGTDEMFIGYLTTDHECYIADDNIEWDAEVYDGNSYHDNVTNPDRIGFNGQTSGFFEIELILFMNTLANAVDTVFGIEANLNGSTFKYANANVYIQNSGTSYVFLKYIINVTTPATDYLTIRTRNSSLTGSCLILSKSGSTYNSMIKVRRLKQ